MLTKQQLLIPRYLCTGTPGKPLWHRSIFNHGDIIAMDDKGWYEVTNEHTGSHIFKNEYFTEYPHLFKPLPWWYGRTVEEMPEYILASKTYGIVKVNEWRCMGELCLALTDDGMLSAANWEFEPADESDYQEYQKQKQ